MYNKNSGDPNFFYYEDPCFLCGGHGDIVTIQNIISRKLRNLTKGDVSTCCLCKGKGFLKIEKGDLEL